MAGSGTLINILHFGVAKEHMCGTSYTINMSNI